MKRTGWVAGLGGLCIVWMSAPAVHAQTIFVTTVADVVDFGGAKQVGDLPGPDGVVSMREAAVAANNTAGPQTIGFQVPAGSWGTGVTGPVLINALTSFPIEGDDTTVDGSTQTAFTGDTNPNGAEVSFHSTVTDPVLIQTGTFAITADRCRFIGLGDMTGRNYGLDLQPTAEECIVQGCVIRAVFAAVRVQGDRNVIGGTLPGEGNRLDSLSDGLRIQGLLGNVASDNVAIGNFLTGDFNGVQITGNATGNRIGGFAPGEANHIAGAGYLQEDGTPDGAMVRIESNGNLVLGNLIGTDASGTAAFANDADVGVEIYGDQNVVRGNVIGGITGLAGFLSVQAGISIREGARGNVIEGNRIGVDASGTIAIPNRVGIVIGAFDASLEFPANNRIGGTEPGAGNVIAHNQDGGVHLILAAIGNEILRNEIRDNHAGAGLGIDLGGDGPTPNDPGDADTGPNALMNVPRIRTAVAGPSGTVVTGRLDTAVPAAARVDLYANPAPAPGEIVEAATWLGAATPLANGFFAVALDGDATGLAITATATDALGSTSEISKEAIATPSPWSDLGFAKAGTLGLPELAGGGPLLAGMDVVLLAAGALPQTPGLLALGATAVFAPVAGGTFVPAPQVLLPVVTDAAGSFLAAGTWPALPSGTTLFAQVWFVDPGAVQGSSATNGLKGTAP